MHAGENLRVWQLDGKFNIFSFLAVRQCRILDLSQVPQQSNEMSTTLGLRGASAK